MNRIVMNPSRRFSFRLLSGFNTSLTAVSHPNVPARSAASDVVYFFTIFVGDENRVPVCLTSTLSCARSACAAIACERAVPFQYGRSFRRFSAEWTGVCTIRMP
jgi:hypothetical protein